MIISSLKISFHEDRTETALRVATSELSKFVFALTKSLYATNIRSEVQFSLHKPELWLAELRLTEFDGAPLRPKRARELLRKFELNALEHTGTERAESCAA